MNETLCGQMWGSHGCDLPTAHFGVHQCGGREKPCSQYVDTPEGPRVRHGQENGTWGEWWPHVGGFRLSEADA